MDDGARIAQEEGAEIVLTGFGRGLRLTERVARRLPDPPDVLELDINDSAHMTALVDELGHRWGRVDGALHAIAYAPEDALGELMEPQRVPTPLLRGPHVVVQQLVDGRLDDGVHLSRLGGDDEDGADVRGLGLEENVRRRAALYPG